jgi:hypothetical protein
MEEEKGKSRKGKYLCFLKKLLNFGFKERNNSLFNFPSFLLPSESKAYERLKVAIRKRVEKGNTKKPAKAGF